MASTFLTRTPSSAGNRKTFTISAWVKRGTISSANSQIISTGVYSSSQLFQTFFESDDTLYISDYTSGGSKSFQLSTNRKLRDINCWYHILFAVDTTQGTASNRVKVYINGVQETSFSEATYPSQNFDCAFNLNQLHTIANRNGTNFQFGGSMSYLASVDGTQELPTIFGEIDTTTGQWKIKTSITPSSGWGTNGFLILKDGNSVTDQSGQGNNWTVGGGTLTKTEDNPSNVFCTLNPLARGDLTNNAILSNGNTYYSSDQTGYNIRVGTIGANKGKWYWEGKFISHNPQTSPGMPLGIIADNIPIATNVAGGQAPYYYAYNYDGSNGTVTYNSSDTNYGTTILNTVGQIGMVALDLDNNKVYFGVNGTWTNSGNPANGTNGYSIIDPADTPLGFYLPAVSDRSSIREYVYAWNFGNGYFGTTAVSSAGTNASENGIFEYDCPAGFTALSTKGLNL